MRGYFPEAKSILVSKQQLFSPNFYQWVHLLIPLVWGAVLALLTVCLSFLSIDKILRHWFSHQRHLQNCWLARNASFRSNPNLLNQNLWWWSPGNSINKLTRGFLCILKFENYCFRKIAFHVVLQAQRWKENNWVTCLEIFYLGNTTYFLWHIMPKSSSSYLAFPKIPKLDFTWFGVKIRSFQDF